MSKVRYGMQKEFDNWLQDIRTPLEWKPGARVELIKDLSHCPWKRGDKATILGLTQYPEHTTLKVEFENPRGDPGKHNFWKSRFKLIR